jgi:hypothetical protein
LRRQRHQRTTIGAANDNAQINSTHTHVVPAAYAAATLPIHKVVKESIAIETINANPTLKAKLVGYAKRISEHHLYEDALLLAIVCSSLLMVGRSWGQDQGRALN